MSPVPTSAVENDSLLGGHLQAVTALLSKLPVSIKAEFGQSMIPTLVTQFLYPSSTLLVALRSENRVGDYVRANILNDIFVFVLLLLLLAALLSFLFVDLSTRTLKSNLLGVCRACVGSTPRIC
jgi:hypothetical protein